MRVVIFHPKTFSLVYDNSTLFFIISIVVAAILMTMIIIKLSVYRTPPMPPLIFRIL